MDFRLQKALKTHMEEQQLLGDADVVSMAGAAKNFLDANVQATALRQVEISKTLHGMKEVHLINHTDCGAYGGKAAFDGDEAEHRKHVEDMTSAAQVIHDAFPELTVVKWLAHLEGEGHEQTVRFEQIA